MAKTFNEELFDAMLRHQIGLLRYAGSVRNQIWRLLDATEADLKRQILSAKNLGIDSPARVARLDALLEKLRDTRLKGWKKVRPYWFQEMRDLARAEPEFFDRTIVGTFSAVELSTKLPDPESLRKVVTSRPFEGKTLKQWADKIQADDIARIESQVKIGVTQSETLPQIAKRIVGSAKLSGKGGMTQITRNQAANIVRTVSNGIASDARSLYAQANADLAPEEVFTATLDARTTAICRRLDGRKFKVGEGPLLPQHFGERSLYSPVIDGEVIGDRPRRDFTQRQLVKEFGQERGIKVGTPKGQTLKAGRAAIPHGYKGDYDAWSRQRMRALTGTTPSKTTYQQWLGGQSASFQNDILGPTRGKLFREGGLTLDKFVLLDGTELTLAQLAQRNAQAFIKAGLDPSAYK